MHAKFRRRGPTELYLLRKREPTPQDVGGSSSDTSDDVSGIDNLPLTGPITFTVTKITEDTSTASSTTNIPTSTITVTATSIQLPSTTSSTSQSTQSSVLSSSTLSSSITTTQPSASAIETGSNNGSKSPAQSNGQTTSRSLSTGAVVGIILATLVVLVIGAVVGMRRRSMHSRLRMRAWANGTSVAVGPPVGSWQTKEFPPNSPPPAPGLALGETSPGVQFAIEQKRVPVPAAPPMSYGNDILSASILTGAATAGSYSALSPSSAAPLAPFSSVVQCTFVPRLPDEMSIAIGERIRVLAEYDDGWALCVNSRGEQGMVPIECLDHPSASTFGLQDNRDAGSFRRVSSLQPIAKRSSGN